MKQALMVRSVDMLILGTALQADPDAGPTIPQDPPPDGVTLVPYAEEFSRVGRDNEDAYWQAPNIVWVATASLVELASAAIARTYKDVDAVYDAAIGRRATVYVKAEAAARAYQALGFTGPVSGYVSGHAENNPTGVVQSPEWAARAIIERADAFVWAELQMRNVCFAHQSRMRAATTTAQLDAAVTAWNDFIVWLRGILGL